MGSASDSATSGGKPDLKISSPPSNVTSRTSSRGLRLENMSVRSWQEYPSRILVRRKGPHDNGGKSEHFKQDLTEFSSGGSLVVPTSSQT